jgi:hypothetical protein
VLAGLRSGGTLIRLALDAHPSMTCSAGTRVTAICADSEQMTTQLGVPAQGTGAKRAAAFINDLFEERLLATGKQRWCDHSIDAAPTADAFARAYPDAQFICVYRHGLDVIASALEAFPWGLNDPSLTRFVREAPTNPLAALASYWVSSSRAILGFEAAHPTQCHRVLYEELVTEPERVIADLIAWLGEDPAPGLMARALRGDQDPRGPGDHKVWATRSIHTSSIGRGRRIPHNRIPRPIRRAVSDLCRELGYDEHPMPAATDAARRAMAALDEDFAEAVRANLGRIAAVPAHWAAALGNKPLKLTVTDGDPAHDVHWLIGIDPPHITRRPVAPEAGVAWTVTADADALLDVVEGRSNLATAIREGRIRISDVAVASTGSARVRLQVMARLFVAEPKHDEA